MTDIFTLTSIVVCVLNFFFVFVYDWIATKSSSGPKKDAAAEQDEDEVDVQDVDEVRRSTLRPF